MLLRVLNKYYKDGNEITKEEYEKFCLDIYNRINMEQYTEDNDARV